MCVIAAGVLLLVVGAYGQTSALRFVGAVMALGGSVVGSLMVIAAAAPVLGPKRRLEVPTRLAVDVARLAQIAAIDPPRVRVVKDDACTAHARSYRGAQRITYTSGMLEHSTPLALEGVTGHELAHIVNGDIRSFRRVDVPMIALLAALPGVLLVLAAAGVLAPAHAAAGFCGLAVVALTWWRATVPTNRRLEIAADLTGARLTSVQAQLAALDGIKRRRSSGGGTSSAFWRWLDPYPTLAERRAGVRALIDVQERDPHNVPALPALSEPTVG